MGVNKKIAYKRSTRMLELLTIREGLKAVGIYPHSIMVELDAAEVISLLEQRRPWTSRKFGMFRMMWKPCILGWVLFPSPCVLKLVNLLRTTLLV